MTEREGNVFFFQSALLTSNAVIIQPYFLVASVTSEKEWEGETDGMACFHPSRKDTKVKDISCKQVFVLRNQVLWIVAPCGWVIAFRRFEVTYHLHLHSYESVK